jgi:hypothetical protein
MLGEGFWGLGERGHCELVMRYIGLAVLIRSSRGWSDWSGPRLLQVPPESSSCARMRAALSVGEF